MCTCVYLSVDVWIWAQVMLEARQEDRLLRTGDTGSCELPSVRAEDWTQLLCKDSKDSQSLILCSPVYRSLAWVSQLPLQQILSMWHPRREELENVSFSNPGTFALSLLPHSLPFPSSSSEETEAGVRHPFVTMRCSQGWGWGQMTPVVPLWPLPLLTNGWASVTHPDTVPNPFRGVFPSC